MDSSHDQIKVTKTEGKIELKYEPKSAAFSGQQLKFIPIDPNFKPTEEQQRDALNYLIRRFRNNQIMSIQTENVNFIDPGQNFDSVSCNLCGRDIEIDYWQQSMTNSHENGFTNLSIDTPCCKEKTSLNELKYSSASGFSKYQLIIIEPKRDSIEISDLATALEQILENRIRLIWANY